MRLEQLRYLIELERYDSLTGVSEKMHITRQALSMKMKNLEDELGSQLLVRSVKGIYFTLKGEALLVFASSPFI